MMPEGTALGLIGLKTLHMRTLSLPGIGTTFIKTHGRLVERLHLRDSKGEGE